ncbi:hypothetical protein RRG08_035818 [Elysia crispata]|uniref:Uncharacterized protein n=1 Tax=Elysia crispata TaxID=231223 RepID=A0AAE1DZG0_9GAST|nr:hypothetical protein RRG08_035818 [Elysia crispata]
MQAHLPVMNRSSIHQYCKVDKKTEIQRDFGQRTQQDAAALVNFSLEATTSAASVQSHSLIDKEDEKGGGGEGVMKRGSMAGDDVA